MIEERDWATIGFGAAVWLFAAVFVWIGLSRAYRNARREVEDEGEEGEAFDEWHGRS